jgi:hypothetical protein
MRPAAPPRAHRPPPALRPGLLLLVLAAPLAVAAPARVRAAPVEPAPRIVNLVADFAAYHDRARGLDAAGRRRAWDQQLEARHRDFFAQVIYRNQTGPDRERHKEWCQGRFWSSVAPRMAQLRTHGPRAERLITATVARFRKHFPDFQPATDFYVTVAFSFRGKVVQLNGRNVFAIGLEEVGLDGPDLEITVAHELFHLYHFQWFKPTGGLYRPLWAEGLATWASALVVPGHRLSAYLGFDAAKMNRCAALLPTLARRLREKLGDHDPRVERAFFGTEENTAGVPPAAGYYVGVILAERAAQRTALKDLARLPAERVLALVAAELDRLAGAKR